MKSTFRKLWYLYACKKSTSSNFLRYCKDIAACYFGNFGNPWLSPSKNIAWLCRKRSCLFAYKESSSSLTSFLIYCREIWNLLFWVIWVCLATRNFKKPSMFICRQKTTSSFMFSLRCCKDIAICYFEYFGHAWLCTPKVIYEFTEIFVFICRYKINFILLVFLEIFQRHTNFLFWVLWTCLTRHTQKDSIKLTSSFTSFLRYYILKNSAILLA